MAGTNFQVSMILRAVNQMSPALQQAAAQIKSLQTQLNQLNTTSNKGTWFDRAITGLDKFSGKLKTAQESMDKLVKSGTKDLFTGAIMAAPIVAAVKSAAGVQDTQTQLRLTGMTGKQVDTLTSQADQTMLKTRFNTGQILNIDLAMTKAGIDYSKMQSLGNTPIYLAELEANRNGADPQTTAKQFAQMTEQLQISTNPAKVKQLAEQVNRIATVTSADMGTLAESSKYFNLIGSIQGLTPSDIMMTQGLAARFGLEGSVGGTHLKDFFQRLNPFLHMGTKMGAPIENAFNQLGWLKGAKFDKKGNVVGAAGDVFHDAKGNLLGADQIFSTIAQTYQKTGNKEQFNALMTKIFGQQGQDIAAAVAMYYKQMGALKTQTAAVPSIDQSVIINMGKFSQQLTTLISTIGNMGRKVGTAMLPSFTKDLKALNNEMPKFQAFLDKHMGLVTKLAEIWAGLAAFKIGSGIAKIAIGAPAREVLGLARGGTSLIKGGLRVGRGISTVGNIYKEFRQLGAGHMMSLWAGIENVIPGMKGIGKVAGKGFGLAKKGFGFAKNIGAGVLENARDIFSPSTFKTAGNYMKTLGSSVLKAAQSAGQLAVNIGKSTIALAANAAKTVAVKTAQLAVTAASRTWAAVQWVVNAAMTANPIGIVIVAVAALVAGIILMVTHWRQVVTVVGQVWNWMRQFATNIGNTFANLWHQAVDWGANIVKGLWQGISNFGGWLSGQVKSFVNNFISGPFKNLLGIHSPSTVFAGYGLNIVQGLVNGMTDTSKAEAAAKRLATRTGSAGAPGSGSGTGPGGSPVQITNQFYITSTDPKGAAKEIQSTQDKYYRSRYPYLPTK